MSKRKNISLGTSFLPSSSPRESYLTHKVEIDRAIQRVLESGYYILNKEVAAFEKEFARYLDVKYAIGVGNGTDALHLALRACGVSHGDAVITVSHTAVATVAAIELAGAIPILIDIDPKTYTMNPDCLEETIKWHIRHGRYSTLNCLKAIIPVHLYGHPADMPAIMNIARRYNLHVIEDCAQSHGAAIMERKTGTWGHLAAFSFYPTKNLGAIGDGGAVTSNNRKLAERVRSLREYGWKEKFISSCPGMNTRLDEIHAAILRIKLHYLNKENARRRTLAQIYNTLLSSTSLKLPAQRCNTEHAYHEYVITTRSRDDIKAFLEKHSIRTQIHYPLPVHLQPAYKKRTRIGKGGLLQTEKIYTKILSLPLYPQMTTTQIQHISHRIIQWDNKETRKV